MSLNAFNIYEAEKDSLKVQAFIHELAFRRRQESQAATAKRNELLDALQALVDNWHELGIPPSDGLCDAEALLMAEGREQATPSERPN